MLFWLNLHILFLSFLKYYLQTSFLQCLTGWRLVNNHLPHFILLKQCYLALALYMIVGSFMCPHTIIRVRKSDFSSVWNEFEMKTSQSTISNIRRLVERRYLGVQTLKWCEIVSFSRLVNLIFFHVSEIRRHLCLFNRR